MKRIFVSLKRNIFPPFALGKKKRHNSFKMTGSDCEKYGVSNVRCLMVPSIGKIPQLKRTNSPKCLRKGSFWADTHPYLQGGEKSACLGEGCTFRAVFDCCTNLCPNVRTLLCPLKVLSWGLFSLNLQLSESDGDHASVQYAFLKGNLFQTACSGEELENKQAGSSYAEEKTP